MKTRSLLATFSLGLGVLAALALLKLFSAPPHAVLAQAGTGVVRVATSGSDVPGCGSSAAPCASVQYAVDQAGKGDEVRIATGVYSGVNSYGGLAQVVYLSKTLTLRGGYTTTNWNVSNPISYPTTLDAQEGGRVLYLTGDISPTIEGLQITGGNAERLNGNGGGVYVSRASAVISGNEVFSNTAANGAGLYLKSSATTLNSTIITANQGSGLHLYESEVTLNGNTICGNKGRGLSLQASGATLNDNTVAVNRGHGLYSDESVVMLSRNAVNENSGRGLYLVVSNAMLNDNAVTANRGGGIYLSQSPSVLKGNTIAFNTADDGGGLRLAWSNAIICQNTIISNTASQYGGGLYMWQSSDVLCSNVVADNQANNQGSGLYVAGSSPRLWHTTLARNSGSSGIYVTDYESLESSVTLTNTILVSHTTGVLVRAGNRATLEGVLWFGNGSDSGGTGTISVTHAITGDPAFAGDGFHILSGSVAVDRGLAVNDLLDVDGDYRPLAASPDLGADELVRMPPPCQARLNGGGPVYTTVQAAIAASTLPTDTVEIAGVCEDAVSWNRRIFVAALTRTLTLRGGYSPNFDTWDPDVYPTALNARSRGGVLGIGAGFSPTVEYLDLLAGASMEGGGIWSVGDGPILRHLRIVYNVARRGGGIYLGGPGGRLEASQVKFNGARHGGGVYLSYSDATFDGNDLTANVAGYGGGLCLADSNALFDGNTIRAGAATYDGGGLHLVGSRVAFNGGIVNANCVYRYGGGLYLSGSAITLTASAVTSNTTYQQGGGLYLKDSNAAFNVNAISANTAIRSGGGLCLLDSDATFNGNIIASNMATDDHDGQGGGLYVERSNITLNDNTITTNVANADLGMFGGGGGISMWYTNAAFNENTISDNAAQEAAGGGVHVISGTATFDGNTISTNTGASGGGLLLWGNNFTLTANLVSANTATFGGGLLLAEGVAVFIENTISNNSAVEGGGLTIWSQSNATFNEDIITSNTAFLMGGGISLQGSFLKLTNTVIADNRANGVGSGLWLNESASARLLHTTIARNTRGDGSGIHIANYESYYSSVAMTNTILVSQAVGITVTAGNTVTLEATLWGTGPWTNGTDWGGAGNINTGTRNYRGDPGFVDPDAGDYHIGPHSAARDVGLDTGVSSDMDGDPRPLGPGPDLGADEYWPPGGFKYVYLPLVLQKAP
jgi:hypothetical protein